MKRLLCLLVFLPVLALAQKRYDANWASLDSRPIPGWFQDAKFGIFIHWGVYSVPAYGPVGTYAEWYWNYLNKGPKDEKGKPNGTYEFHKRVYGENFPYQNFAPMFKAELFDPEHWATVFERSGAKYIALTSKHHEGFTLWPNEQASRTWGRPWNAMEVGPHRDLLGDLGNSVRKHNLKMGIYYSMYEWFNPLWLSDKKRYISEHMTPQFKDVVTRYKPSIIFSDGEWDLPSEEWHSPELLAWLFNESPVKDEVVIDDRWGKETRHKHGSYYTTEYASGMQDSSHPWEESRGMGFSYGYNRAETASDYRTPRQLVLMLVDLVSRGGNLLLDIGPTGDGRIPVIMEERLLQMGEWLKVNGDAIYGTRQWKRTRQWSEGKQPELKSGQYMVKYDIENFVDRKEAGQAVVECFFTAKDGDLYAIVPGWPDARQFTVKDVKLSAGSKVTLLGRSEPLPWKASSSGIVIDLPPLSADAARAQYAYTLKLTGVQ